MDSHFTYAMSTMKHTSGQYICKAERGKHSKTLQSRSTATSGQICQALSESSAQESRICADSAHLRRTLRIKIRILQLAWSGCGCSEEGGGGLPGLGAGRDA